MFNKLFGGKKSDSYYLELKETEDSQLAAKTESIKAVEETKVEPAQAIVVEEKAESTPAKGAKKASNQNKKAAQKEMIVQAPNPKAPTTPEELIRAAVAISSNGKPEAEEVAGFASQYLITSTLSRRRPGPSLNPFKDMASQMNRK